MTMDWPAREAMWRQRMTMRGLTGLERAQEFQRYRRTTDFEWAEEMRQEKQAEVPPHLNAFSFDHMIKDEPVREPGWANALAQRLNGTIGFLSWRR